MRKRKIKFALELKDGEEARSMEELRAHFDLEKIIGYFQDGKLVEWLDDRFYTNEADEIKRMSECDTELGRKICKILGVEYTEVEDAETIAWRKERLERLKQYTAESQILEQVDMVAFDQDDLEDIIREEDVNTIYLCGNDFVIPSGMINKKNVKYVGIPKHVKVKLDGVRKIELKESGISFDNIEVEGGEENIVVNEDELHDRYDRPVEVLSKYLYDLMKKNYIRRYDIAELLYDSSIKDSRRTDAIFQTKLYGPSEVIIGVFHDERYSYYAAFTDQAFYLTNGAYRNSRRRYEEMEGIFAAGKHEIVIVYKNGSRETVECFPLEPDMLRDFLREAKNICDN